MADYDPDNIFAKILRGELPSHTVHEDEDTIVIMDVMPQAPGHALVIPKSPARNLLDAEPMALGAAIVVAQRVARASKVAFEADGISVLQFNETAGGQSVFHLHFHVIPRHDGVPLKPHTGGTEDNEVLANNAEKLRQALAAR